MPCRLLKEVVHIGPNSGIIPITIGNTVEVVGGTNGIQVRLLRHTDYLINIPFKCGTSPASTSMEGSIVNPMRVHCGTVWMDRSIVIHEVLSGNGDICRFR